LELKDIGNTFYDFARAGLVVGKKALEHTLADERYVEPELVSQLVGQLHPERVKAKVSEVILETESTRTLRLVPEDMPFPPFRAGQFVTIFVKIDGVETSRAYTISSPPSRPYIDLTVREMPDGFVSRYLCNKVSVGDRFELAGPAGAFYHEPLMDSGDLVFLAGGSGVTPFMSIIQDSLDRDLGLKMQLLYGSRVPEDIIFEDRLSELACAENDLKVDYIISEPPEGYEGVCGFLEADIIKKLVGDLEGKTFYMCGPNLMYELCGGALDSLGIPSRRVKKELSGPPPDITAVEGWPEGIEAGAEFTVKVEGKRKKLTVKAGEPLLNSLERNKITIENLCRSGECGMCRTRLVSGEVFMPGTVNLRSADAALGYIHPCMSYPISDIEIRLPY
jgi:ferredoxin-NADP reductase